MGVDPTHPSLGPARLPAELRRDAQRVHQLRLAGSEFPEELSDGPRFNASPEEGVELLAPCMHLCSRQHIWNG